MLKKILNKFLDSINSETDIDESRRRVVKGIAGLAALAAVGANLDLGFKAITKYEFDKMAASGVIENVTFYLDRTLVIRNLDGLVLKNCRYIALDGFVGDCMLRIEKTSNLILNGGYFDTRKLTGVGIKFDYDQGRYMSLDMLTIKNTL